MDIELDVHISVLRLKKLSFVMSISDVQLCISFILPSSVHYHKKRHDQQWKHTCTLLVRDLLSAHSL